MAPPESLLKQNYNAFSSLSEKRFAVSRLFRTTKQPKVKAENSRQNANKKPVSAETRLRVYL